MKDSLTITARGTLEILDEQGKVIRRQNNQIHPENISQAVALALGNKDNGPIEKMVFGSGGSIVNGIGNITYLSKNVIGSNAQLYNQTYEKIVDDLNLANSDPVKNKIEVFHVDGNIFSDIQITCTLDLNEPSGQSLVDTSNTTEDDFVFDEIGVKAYGGKLLSHVIFSPVQKSSNRVIIVRYTIRIQSS